MKKDMPLEGLRWSRDSGSALYDTPPNGRSRTGWGGKILQKYFPVSVRAILEKNIRIALCRLGIYSFIKRFAKSIIKDLKRS